MDNTLQLLIDSFWPLFKAGLTISVPLMLVSFILGLVVAFAVALMRMSKWKPLKAISWFYVWVIRGTPLIVQIFIIFFGLAYVGIILDPIPAAILALTISQGAYNSEVIRAALGSIPKGQNEACRALGLNKWQTMSRIIVPQAALVAVPSLGNSFISLLKAGYGTLAYRDEWNLFDNIIVSENLATGSTGSLKIQPAGNSKFYSGIFRRPYMIQKEGQYKGYPLRTFVGNDFQGGFSDHFPVYIYIAK